MEGVLVEGHTPRGGTPSCALLVPPSLYGKNPCFPPCLVMAPHYFEVDLRHVKNCENWAIGLLPITIEWIWRKKVMPRSATRVQVTRA
jgi:hypothetical protein